MAQPRVLFVSKPIVPPWHDGSKNLVRDVATHLEQAWPTVLTTAGQGSALGPRVRTEALYREAGRFSPSMLANARVLLRLLLGDPQDVWHFVFAPNPASSHAALLAKTLRRRTGFQGPVVQTVASAPRSFEGVGRLVFGDVVIALTEWTRGRLLGAGLTGVPVRVIPPCVRAPEAPSRDAILALRARHDLGEGPVVLYPGDYELSRGAWNVAGALPELARAFPDARFVFACRAKTPGAAGAEAELQRRIARAGLSSRVRYLGEVDDMSALLASSTLVAFPVDDLYGKVDLPLVLLEAMALGVPLVVAEGGPLEALSGAALLVPPGHDASLAEAVASLLKDPGARRSASLSGKRMYDARFTPAVIARAHDALYAELLEGRKSPLFLPRRTW